MTEPMVRADYVRMMAKYNAEMNRRLYEAAARLPTAERNRARGAFWGSIQGTLSHLLWADQMWMSRFDGLPKPEVPLKDSGSFAPEFDALARDRQKMDAAILAWSDRVTDAWLAEDLAWYSGAIQKEMKMRRDLLVAHFINHQTHHRGQVHALITAAGEKTGDTDLFLVVAA